ncbi:hypothetical protein BGZ63DRAFT_379112 [Mariannaea sp. PMI_226]|nr:hypothetical protein BGZ63DRAFT_379112 [Mariannaea sp. PMI_226]
MWMPARTFLSSATLLFIFFFFFSHFGCLLRNCQVQSSEGSASAHIIRFLMLFHAKYVRAIAYLDDEPRAQRLAGGWKKKGEKILPEKRKDQKGLGIIWSEREATKQPDQAWQLQARARPHLP